MSLDVASLPDDAAFLKALLVEVDADRTAHKLIAERLRMQLARLSAMISASVTATISQTPASLHRRNRRQMVFQLRI